MIWIGGYRTERPLCVADFPDLGDPTITGPNDILGHPVRCAGTG